ncbi:fimbria/pilus outer membrane usher protein [Bordetella avium]|uniref:fimbria/pilus outer membrane usher protein n=1 Tax=Bordetella avium TaxID=521 RepID=UPI000FD93A06|nr:fimbria/pilus outer membrane usher protein [Bordetella avium]AZY52653.1 outer membrane fimbrial usher protein [Bordetella avium]
MFIPHKPKLLRLALSAAFLSWGGAQASTDPQASTEQYADLQFNPMMLWGSASKTDLTRFSRRNVLQPGVHRVEVQLNDQRVLPMTVSFLPAKQAEGKAENARACFSQEQLETLGINIKVLSPALQARLSAGDCVGVTEIYPDSLENFDYSTSQLAISVPQAYVLRKRLRDVSPDQWQTGITAFRSNYSYSYHRADYGSGRFQSLSALFNSGLNVGGWYLRNSAFLNHSDGKTLFRSQRTWLQTDVPAWRARVVMGDIYAGSEYFSTYGMRGALLSTDPAMLPYSERLYRPTVRGVASTQATVKIMQANSVIYQGQVAPGPFAIDDYSPVGYGGDLHVTVTEADGSVQRFSVPFGNAVRLIRPGTVQYSVGAGRYKGGYRGGPEPLLMQATGRWGVSDGFNLYGGGLVAGQNYAAVVMGAAFNTAWGAFSLDSTSARTRPVQGRQYFGNSYRLSYSKTLEPTGTVLRLATLRYSSERFWTLSDALSSGSGEWRMGRPRGEFSLALNQPLGRYGSLYLSGSVRDYWGSSARRMQWTLNYGTQINGVGLSLEASTNSGSKYGQQRQFMLNLAIPLSRFNGTIRTSVQQQTGGHRVERVGYDAVLGEDRALSYGVDVSRSDREMSYGMNASYAGRYGRVGGTLSQQAQNTQLSVNGSGGLLVHKGGITLGQTLSESVGLIEARDAGGASIGNMANASLNDDGYGLVSLSPYSLNEVQISPENLSLDVELQSTVEEAIPRAGAVVPLVFSTRREQSALLVVGKPYRSRFPFGTAITDAEGKTLGTAGQGGRALLRGLPSQGVLKAVLSDGTVCRTPYELGDDKKTGLGGLPSISLRCENTK